MGKVILWFTLVFGLATLIGCQASSTNASVDEEPPANISTDRESPVGVPVDEESRHSKVFNTLSDSPVWGDEADFFRAADITLDPYVYYDTDFMSEEVELHEGMYIFSAFAHNASGKLQEDLAYELSYPDVLLAGEDNLVDVELSWGDGDDERISDSLIVHVDEDLVLVPTFNASYQCMMVTDLTREVACNPDRTETIDGRTIHTLEVGKIYIDANYVISIVLSPTPVDEVLEQTPTI